jgi:3-hydroxyacyl-[acyl-carrier-protein] dehydratase
MSALPTDLPLRPHARAVPLVAVDDVEVRIEHERRVAHACKVVDDSDPYMAGHFPGFTIYPGVFVLETVVQAVAAALDVPVALACVRSMRFTAPLMQGDRIELDAAVAHAADRGMLVVDAECRRGDGVVAARIRLDLSELAGA